MSSTRRRRSPTPPSRSPSPPPNPAYRGVVHELSYKVPIAEFLSSLYLENGVLHFQLMNHDPALSLDQINAIIGAPTESTFSPNDPILGYSDHTWWNGLTHQHPYASSSAKASSLIHPMMKVAHRIIASLDVPREERSTICALELKILYAMAHPDENPVPHYGLLLCNKLTRLSTSQSRKIYCGGIVSLFSKTAPVRDPYTGIHHPLPGDPYLTTTVLESMRMFRAEDGNHNWTMGQNHDPKLLITPENQNILSLRRPTNFTDCKITPYLFPISFFEEEDKEGEESGKADNSGKAAPQNSPPMGGASSSRHAGHPSYHQQYMDQFQSIHTRLDTYHQELTNLTQSFSSFTTQYA
ncbi:unnamed protein product [Lactuca saligna]|uniref:Arabidopsis retrotransposon Orf1 C-terminal domain-containing protein n=1 Tax=Lactuca saligna TaxID=75948 RepID=A0AA35YVM7_LACSI|nr:unnamed protein product [Lactuca saligna]